MKITNAELNKFKILWLIKWPTETETESMSGWLSIVDNPKCRGNIRRILKEFHNLELLRKIPIKMKKCKNPQCQKIVALNSNHHCKGYGFTVPFFPLKFDDDACIDYLEHNGVDIKIKNVIDEKKREIKLLERLYDDLVTPSKGIINRNIYVPSLRKKEVLSQ